VPFGQVLEEKMAEAGSASGLEAALSEFVSAATSGAAMQVVDEELLEVTVEHKYTVLTYKQVVEVFNRTPKALRLRSVNAKLFGKLHRGEKVLYAFRKKREYPTLRLVTRVGVRKETTKRAAAPEHFQRHGRLLLDAATDELMSNTKTMTLMRLPTVEGGFAQDSSGGRLGGRPRRRRWRRCRLERQPKPRRVGGSERQRAARARPGVRDSYRELGGSECPRRQQYSTRTRLEAHAKGHQRGVG
jgi:hypothetical protein